MIQSSSSAALLGRLDTLRALVAPSTRPSFHAFEHESDRLVYDILAGAIFEASEVMHEILLGFEAGAESNALARALERHPAGAIDEALADLEKLHGAGFLHSEPDYDEATKHSAVRQLADHHPRKMMLMVQSNCNLACTYCYEVISGFHSTGKRMDSETGRRSVEFLIQRSGSRRDLEITFFGGEPLMNFELVRELVTYCRSREADTGKRFSFQMTTNCTLLDDEKIEYLVANQFSMMLSIDGPPELHDVHRKDLGGAGTGAVALEKAKALVAAQRAAGVREAMIRVTMTHENHNGRALAAYFAAQGFARVMLGSSDGRAGEKESWDVSENDLVEMKQEHGEALDSYLAWLDGRGPRPSDAAQLARNVQPMLEALQNPNPAPKVRCGVGRNMQAVTRDGKIYPCHRYAGEDAYQLGTLETGLDARKVEDYYASLVRVKEQHCSHCWARVTCGGQCPWYISKTNGEIGLPDETSCNGIRSGHERQLWFVHQLKKRGRLEDLRDLVAKTAELELPEAD